MSQMPTPDCLLGAYQSALSALLSERNSDGYWTGELSTSALSTATAVGALALVCKHSALSTQLSSLISGGLAWLGARQNADGGWGDTIRSISNISTTMLCRAAFHIAGAAAAHSELLRRADGYLQE